jgi:DNA adenine methylase
MISFFLTHHMIANLAHMLKNEFTRKDQERLANYLINNCKAKWMMIIKNTDFIFDLYNDKGLNIQSFDKKLI